MTRAAGNTNGCAQVDPLSDSDDDDDSLHVGPALEKAKASGDMKRSQGVSSHLLLSPFCIITSGARLAHSVPLVREGYLQRVGFDIMPKSELRAAMISSAKIRCKGFSWKQRKASIVRNRR